jgi:hypothetical protein
MKCPKCGYNSFDYLDSCKKCNKDLTEHKARFNIQSILLSEMPTETVTSVAEEVVATATADVVIDDFGGGGAAAEVDDFGFDFMGDSDDDENLAFDELFEEVSSEDDIEEALPSPEAEAEPVPLDQQLAGENISGKKETVTDDFSFDETEPDLPAAKPVETTPDSPAEFGFDADDDPAADIFAETEEDFSLDGIDFENPNKS